MNTVFQKFLVFVEQADQITELKKQVAGWERQLEQLQTRYNQDLCKLRNQLQQKDFDVVKVSLPLKTYSV